MENKLELTLNQQTKNEVRFLEEIEAPKNEHDVYLFASQNGHMAISLDFLLLEYKNWLIENKLVKSC